MAKHQQEEKPSEDAPNIDAITGLTEALRITVARLDAAEARISKLEADIKLCRR